MEYLQPGASFDGRYMLSERIGHGASGEVWLARDHQIPRNVALKVMNATLMLQPIHLERFQREIDSLNELGNSHPNIPQLYYANTTSERPYIIMEYIGGNSLKTLIDTRLIHNIPFKLRVTHVIQQIADALTFAHDRGIVHRDIKPENVKLMGQTDRVYLLDFSIAVLNTNETRSGVGTPKYLPPEIVSSKAADMFSFGVVCYEILMGRHPIYDDKELVLGPFQAKEMMEERLSNDRWALPSQVATGNAFDMLEDIDWDKIDVVFRQILSLNPEQRPTNPQALVSGLRAAIHAEATSEMILSELQSERVQIQAQDELGVTLDSSSSTQIDPPEIPASAAEKVSPSPPYVVKASEPQTITTAKPAQTATPFYATSFFYGIALILLLIGIIIGVLIS